MTNSPSNKSMIIPLLEYDHVKLYYSIRFNIIFNFNSIKFKFNQIIYIIQSKSNIELYIILNVQSVLCLYFVMYLLLSFINK